MRKLPLDPPPWPECRWTSCPAKPTHRIASECTDHGRLTEDFCETHLKVVMEAKRRGEYVCGHPSKTGRGDCDKPLRQSEPIELYASSPETPEEDPCPLP